MKVIDTIEDYDRRGGPYSAVRQPDAAIESLICEQLGNARFILNVGAGTGSYEPRDRHVIAVEPSSTMRANRASSLPPALNCVAENLPFDANAFDASLAVLTIHHWPNLVAGLHEVRRVTRGPVVIMTFDPDAHTEFWMADYVPEMTVVERRRYPSIDRIEAGLASPCRVLKVPVSVGCTDRFQVALYGRPEEFLREEVRRSQSAWNFVPDGVEERFVTQLREELRSGKWDAKYGYLRTKPTIECQLRLVVSDPTQK